MIINVVMGAVGVAVGEAVGEDIYEKWYYQLFNRKLQQATISAWIVVPVISIQVFSITENIRHTRNSFTW